MNNFKLKRNITKLLLCGGGFKFYYLYGSFKYLYEINVIQNVTEYIGVSAGAMLSLLFLLGYTPDELNKFILEFQFDKLIVPHIDNLLDKKGLDDGEILKFTMQQFLIKKKFSENITFSELFQKTNKKLVFIAANITKNKLEIIDHTTYPNLPICQGILITSALPLLFQPVLYNDNYLIDGGVFDNYPIDLFLDENILGINLSTNLKIIDFNIDFFNYITKLFMISHHWKNINKIDKYKKYTIEIKTYDSSELLNTELSTEEKNRRILYGYDCAKTHIEEYEIEEEEEEEEEEKEENKNIISNEELIKKMSSIDYII
jgi:NTE family protein